MNNYFSFALLIAVILASNWLFSDVLEINALQYNYLRDFFTDRDLQKVMEIKNKWDFVINYILFPLFIFIKVIIISTILYTGTFLSKNFSNISYKQILTVIIEAEYIQILNVYIKIIWFMYLDNNYTFVDIMNFTPFSLQHVFYDKNMVNWLAYILQTISIVEIIYIGYISSELAKINNKKIIDSLKIIASSYIPAILLWNLIVVLIYLNNS